MQRSHTAFILGITAGKSWELARFPTIPLSLIPRGCHCPSYQCRLSPSLCQKQPQLRLCLPKVRFWGTDANEEKSTLAAGSNKESCKKGTRNPTESLPNPQEGDSFELGSETKCSHPQAQATSLDYLLVGCCFPDAGLEAVNAAIVASFLVTSLVHLCPERTNFLVSRKLRSCETRRALRTDPFFSTGTSYVTKITIDSTT